MNQKLVVATLLIAVGLVATISFAWPAIIRPSSITVSGTVENGVEAGCVILRADDGTQYLLTGQSVYPPAGTRVTVTGFYETNVASYCMQGTAVIHAISFSASEYSSSFSVSYGTATASTASVITGNTQESTTVTGAPITVTGYVYTVVESPKCYPQCLAPSLMLTYLYVPPGTGCTDGMACYPPPRYYRLLRNSGIPYVTGGVNSTYLEVTGVLVTPSSWNCDSFYVPEVCFIGDIYVQTITYP